MRLGDVDKLLYHKRKVMFFGLGQDDECWGFAVPVEEIDKAPTIDAVPVVRCARCRHGEAFKTFPGGIFCPYIKDTVPPDGYCYMGEENTYD
jgi:hypothetical protein